jgi:hypothetical protein
MSGSGAPRSKNVRQFDSTNDFIEVDTDWPADLKSAKWWRMTAEMLAEWVLEKLPYWHPERRSLTALLQTIRLGDSALVGEYREWQKREPKMTAAMAHAGRLHNARTQRRLARWLVRTYGQTTP